LLFKMNCLHVIAAAFGPVASPKCWLAVVITLIFATFGRLVRGVTNSGAAAGAAVCLALLSGLGWSGFAGLCTVFALTWAATRFGYARKLSLGTAEPRSGRNAAQVFANIAVAALCSVGFAVRKDPRLLFAAAAALAEAAADTASSEIGQAVGGTPRLLTSWGKVSAGTDGGITVLGTAAGLAAAVIVGAVFVLSETLGSTGLLVITAAAFAGTLADSLLGATLERFGWIGNNTVNFLSTLVAAAIAFAVS
jgi:uncharacterized protein (TIGR00297 family)